MSLRWFRDLCILAILSHVLTVLLWILAVPLPARSADINPSCPDAAVFSGRLITDICWTCLFPIRLGVALMGGTNGDIPSGAAAPQMVCVCPDPAGLPQIGIQFGLWQPTWLMEVVRIPYCSPALGGIRLQDSFLNLGGPVELDPEASTHKVYYNFHQWAFPLLSILDLFTDKSCDSDGFVDVDLVNISEKNPFWSDDELAAHVNFEGSLFGNPLSQALCVEDAAQVMVGEGFDSLFFCAGDWGSPYPFTGNVLTQIHPPRDTSLIAVRALSMWHRLGFARRTMGSDVLCGGKFQVYINKSQYRFEQFYPLAEANGKHRIGQHPFAWGEWRNIPAVGEDFEHLVWRWKDCCLRGGG